MKKFKVVIFCLLLLISFVKSGYAISTPVLSTPTNGTTNSTTPYFSWGAVSTATSYRIMVSDNIAALPIADTAVCSACTVNTVTSGGATSYTPSSGVLQISKTYYWQIRAANDAGERSAWSPIGWFYTVTAQLPSSPTNMVAVGSSNNILMQWADNSNNETGFKLERKTGVSGTYSQITSSGAGVNAYQDSSLTFGTTYCYRVRAYNANGDSSYSNESCGTALATPTLSSPADGATLNTNSVTLQWNGITGAEGYGAEMASSCGGSNILSNPSTATSSITVTGIANGTYYWRVKAFNNSYSGLSSTSGCRSLTVSTGSAPAAPTSMVAVGSSNNILMQWADNSSNESGFKIERKTGTTGTYSQITTVGGGVNAYQDSSLTFGTTYCYRVRAYNANGDSSYSNESCGTALATPALTSPADGATINTNSVTLQWNGVAGAEGYGAEMASSCGGSNILSNPSTATPSITVTGLANGTYYWRVNAFSNTYKGLSATSDCRSVTINTTTSALSTPILSSPFSGATGVSNTQIFSWDPVATATSYRIMIATDPAQLPTGDTTTCAGCTYNAITEGSTTSFAPSPDLLSADTTYYWQVRAANDALQRSPWSQKWSFTTAAVATNLPPSGAYIQQTDFSYLTSHVSNVYQSLGSGLSGMLTSISLKGKFPYSWGDRVQFWIDECDSGPSGFDVVSQWDFGCRIVTDMFSVIPQQNGDILQDVNVLLDPTKYYLILFYQDWLLMGSTNPESYQNGSVGSIGDPNSYDNVGLLQDAYFKLTIAPTASEIISNGDFEQGVTSWTRSNDFYVSTDTQLYPYPHAGSGYAWLANSDGTPGNSLAGSLSQSIQVPLDANTVTLSFWYNITSEETAAVPKDVLSVMILDAAGAPLALAKTLSNLDKQATPGDYRQASFDLTPYRGQTIRLQFLGTTDSYAPTVFRIDDVSINASLTLPNISGSVTYGGTGIASVTLGLSDGGASTSATTAANGSYAFHNLANASYSIVPVKSGYSFNPPSRQLTVVGSDVSGQNFEACFDQASLSGAVTDKTTGTALAGVTVTVDGTYQRTTDGNGVYTFSGLTCGVHTVSITASGYQSYNYSVDISATPILDINLTKTATVYGSQAASGYAADPVNTATGNYIYQRKDLEIPGRGIPLAFERNYNSQAAAKDGADGSLGFGWTHSYDIRLDVADASPGTITHGDGRTETWTPDGLGGYTPQYGVFDKLLNNGDGTYTLKKKDLTRYNFDASGMLASITDKNGNSVGLTYAGSNLTRVTDTVGREIVLAYNASNRITTITDPINRTVQFTYDGNGNLVTATDMNGNVTTYTYDASHQMLTVVDPRGNTVVSNVYDEQERVVNSQRDAKLGQTSYLYNESTRETVITDQLDNNTYHYHDDLLRLIQEKDPRGNSTYYTYDAAGNRTEVKDKNGNTTTYAYDANGNVTSKTDPLDNLTTITYDANNNPLSRTDALGKTTTFEYDSNGNLNKTIDPLGHLSAITYNGNGQPLTVTDPRGNTATNTYDGQGNLLEVADPLGNKTSFTYDEAGRRLTATDALARVTTYVYDNNNNLLSATDPLGNVVLSSYDGNNNRLTATDAKGNASAFVYDVKDLLVTTTDPFGKTMTITYDPLDRKTAVMDKLGNSTNFSYDSVGNLLAVSDPLGNTTSSTYDANGNKLTASDPLGHQTTFIYDELNRVIGARDSLGNIATTSYDQAGRVVATTNAKGQTTAFEYDALGRLTTVTDANNGTVTYIYDANGNRLAMIDPNGNTTTYAYDALNRLTTKTEPLGVPYSYLYDAVGNMTSMTDPKGKTTTYAYDPLNRLQSVTYPDSSTVTYSYDANANRTAMTDSLGTSAYQYDILNRLTGYSDAFGKNVGYGYDANGNRVSLTYPDGKIVTYGYDAASRLISVKDWGNRTTAYDYDAAGRLTTTTNANGTVAAYTYDNAGRLTGLINRKADNTVISSYSYILDAIGNHLQVVQQEPLVPGIPAEDTSYTYDADNRVTSAGAIANTFDANGNLIAKGSDTYGYDSNDRLIASTIGGVASQYSYDGQGNRLARTSGGMTTRYALDINGKLANVLAETDGSGAITAHYVHGLGLISKVLPGGTASTYHYDSRGSTIALTDTGQNVTDAYAYDTFGSVANSNGFSQNTFRYVGKFGLMDEGNGLTYVRARYYAPGLGRFITKDPLTGKDGDSQSLNRYVYSFNNPVILMDVSGFSPQEGVSTLGEKNNSDGDVFHHVLISSDNISAFDYAKVLAEFVGPMFGEFAGNKIYENGLKYGPKIFSNGLSYDRETFGYLTKNGAKFAGELLTLKDLFGEITKEINSRGVLSVKDINYALSNPAEAFNALRVPDINDWERASTSAAAMSWNTLTAPLQKVGINVYRSGQDIQNNINEMVANPKKFFAENFKAIGL